MLLMQLILLVPLIPGHPSIITILILYHAFILSLVLVLSLLIHGLIVIIHLLLIITSSVIFPSISILIVDIVIIWDRTVLLRISATISLTVVAVVLVSVATFFIVDLSRCTFFFLIAGHFQVYVWSIGCHTTLFRVIKRHLSLILAQTDSNLIIGAALFVFTHWITVDIDNTLIVICGKVNYVFIIYIIWRFLSLHRIYSGVLTIKTNKVDTIYIVFRGCLICAHPGHLCKKFGLVKQGCWILDTSLRIGLNSWIHYWESAINWRLEGIAKKSYIRISWLHSC